MEYTYYSEQLTLILLLLINSYFNNNGYLWKHTYWYHIKNNIIKLWVMVAGMGQSGDRKSYNAVLMISGNSKISK